MADALSVKETQDAFRRSLEDVADLAEKLKVYFPSVGDLVDACRLALTNDGQLKLLLAEVTRKR